MNQARTTYRDDYSPYGWVENNLNINDDVFCSPDNIDDCLKYVSQELCALGYPSIYSNSNSCPYAINCDIVKYLNATFEILKKCQGHVQAREDLEDRNQRLYSDLNQLNKKNSVLKRSLDETERKYVNALERERELKAKHEEILQLLKSEKDEVRKLSSQLQRQKIAHQHEIRKQEATINQMKSKISQLLSDKNPNKKVAASISPSCTLQRNGSQRAKWQTGTVAKSSLEEMYNSVISSYENRWKDAMDEYYNFMEYVQSQLIEIISILKNEDKEVKCVGVSNTINGVSKQGRNVQHLKEYLKWLIFKVRETALQNVRSDAKCFDELVLLKSKLCEYEVVIEKYKESEQVSNSEAQAKQAEKLYDADKTELLDGKPELEKVSSCIEKKVNICGSEDEKAEKLPEAERNDLLNEKITLEKMAAGLEKEKANIEIQKLDLIRCALLQKVPESQWHQGLKTNPSVCVITTRSGLTAVPTKNQLKLCLSAPDQFEKILDPLWKSQELKVQKNIYSKSNEELPFVNKLCENKNSCSDEPTLINLANVDLPSWAVANSEEKHIEIKEAHDEACDKHLTKDETEHSAINVSANNIADESSCEELNFIRLKAAMEDIEQRRKVSSPTV